jgi:transposase InsO family protein
VGAVGAPSMNGEAAVRADRVLVALADLSGEVTETDLRRELLDRLLIINERHLRQAQTEYLEHYNTARPHRALGQLAPAQADTGPPKPINLADYQIRRKQALGGLTHEYQIAA